MYIKQINADVVVVENGALALSEHPELFESVVGSAPAYFTQLVYVSPSSTTTPPVNPDGTLNNSAIPNTALTHIPQGSFKGRVSPSNGPVEDISIASMKNALAVNNVDNTSDANKPISSATQTALNAKAPTVHTHAPDDITGTAVITTDSRLSDSRVPKAHTHAQSDITNLVTDLSSKLSASGNGSALTGLTKTQVGLGNVDNTSDLNKPVSTDTQTAITAINNNSSYRVISSATASHIAARVAGTYILANGNPAAIVGTGTLYPINIININNTDYPTVNDVTTKLKIKATLSVNNVAPTGNYTFGLYPLNSGAGAAGLKIYTVGTVVSGSQTTTITAPASSSMTNVVSVDFTMPANGNYVIGMVTTATVATSSLVHINASLLMRN